MDKTVDTLVKMKDKKHDKKGFNGYKNFPKLLLKLMLKHEYIYDYITYWTLAAEIYPERILNTPYINFGAVSGVIASVMHLASSCPASLPSLRHMTEVTWLHWSLTGVPSYVGSLVQSPCPISVSPQERGLGVQQNRLNRKAIQYFCIQTKLLYEIFGILLQAR